MNSKVSIEIDAWTADLLEAHASERGISMSDLLADLVRSEYSWLREFEQLRLNGEGPWAPEVLSEDPRRLAEYRRTGEAIPLDQVKAWIQSWDTANELPPPRPRKL